MAFQTQLVHPRAHSCFGFDEPCGSWQVVHEATSAARPVGCSKTNGPRFSVWQVRHGGSPARVSFKLSRPGRPWGSWQEVQSMIPATGRCVNGFSRIDAARDGWQLWQRL